MLAKRLWSCRRIDLIVGEKTCRRNDRHSIGMYSVPRGARVAQWWEHLPPTNVARVQIRRWCHIWVEFVVGSLPCSERFFSRYSGFPLSSKTNISKFQFDQESGRRRTTMWMCYLQIVIYLFYLYLFYSKNDSLHCGKCTFKLLTWTLEKRRN